jgi:hypothetical protein
MLNMTIFDLQILRLIFPHVRGIFLSHFLTVSHLFSKALKLHTRL